MTVTREYKYIEHSISVCPICLKRSDAKIVEKDNSIFIIKKCAEHGEFCNLLEEDSSWFHNRKLYDKPGNKFTPQTENLKGCPFDCGLCPSHEQHTCIGLIEITTRCNLNCPVCFADSRNGNDLSIENFNRMLDFFVASEGGSADILQISGGEPSLHPEIIKFIHLARSKNIGYVMLNTNGLRIAEDIDFVKELSQFKGGFEVYLQFDGFDESTHKYFRGKPLFEIKQKAIENLDNYNIPVTLVSTIEQGINDHELGRIVNLGFSKKSIRGINIQPLAYFGRLPDDKSQSLNQEQPHDRLTITSIMRKIEEQTSSMVRKSDFIPLPCDADRVALTYFYRDKKQGFIPLTREVDLKKYLPYIRNTFKFDPDDFIKELSSNIFTKECCNVMGFFKDLAKIVPAGYLLKSEEEKISYVNNNTFRISITSFIDAFNFDIKSAQKECVHFITPDLRKIPFSTYNLLHRNNA